MPMFNFIVNSLNWEHETKEETMPMFNFIVNSLNWEHETHIIV